MKNSMPRRLISELITRWQLEKLPAIIVEGPFDQRIFELVKKEDYCTPSIKDIDFLPSDSIEIPSQLTQKHGITGTGAKQRVIAFIRETEGLANSQGFLGIIDKDLDQFLGESHCSPSIFYTDYSCLDNYLWSPDVLRRLTIIFKRETSIDSVEEYESLYSSINSTCADLTAVRITAARFTELELKMCKPERSLIFSNKSLSLDLSKYVRQCTPKRGKLEAATDKVVDIRREVSTADPLDLVNGHDLVMLLTFTLKQLKNGDKTAINEEIVENSLIAFGVVHSKFIDKPMFRLIDNWATSV